MRHLQYRTSVIAALLLAAGVAQATPCEKVASLERVEGAVKVQEAGSVVRRDPSALPLALCVGQRVLTFANGRAEIRTDSKDRIVLDASSTLEIMGPSKVGVDEGKALFVVKKRGAAKGFEVATKLSVIGVKGTRFLVSERVSASEVLLQEGRVNVESTGQPFEVYQAVVEEFEAYKEGERKKFDQHQEEERRAFDAYRAEMAREFVGYKQSIDLEPGQQLSLRGRDAVTVRPDSALLEDMEALARWLGPGE